MSSATPESKPDIKPMGDTWLLFSPEDTGVPDAVRFRRLVKFAGRTLGLKCKRVCGKAPPEADNPRQ